MKINEPVVSTKPLHGEDVSAAAPQQAFSTGMAASAGKVPPVEIGTVTLFKATSLAPSSGPPDDADNKLDKLHKASEYLQILGFSKETANVLARALVELAGQQRKDALAGRLLAREEAKSKLMAQADDMRESAEKMITGAVVSLVVAVVGATISIGLSGVSFIKSASILGKMRGELNTIKALGGKDPSTFSHTDAHDLKSSEHSMTTLSAKNNQWSAAGTTGQTVNSLSQASANASNTIAQADAKLSDADGTELSAEAQYAQGQADIKKEIQQGLDEMIKAIINFIKELQEAKVNQMQSLTKV